MHTLHNIMNPRNCFKIECDIPGLINEDYVFEQHHMMLCHTINQINESRENESYKKAFNTPRGYFSPRKLSSSPYLWKWVFVKRTYRKIFIVSENISSSLFDGNQWTRIIKYANKIGKKISNPIDPVTKVIPRIFFDMTRNQVFEKSLLMCFNMNAYFEHFEKQVTTVIDRITQQIANTPPRDFLRVITIAQSHGTECYFTTQMDLIWKEIHCLTDYITKFEARFVIKNKYMIKIHKIH